MIISTEDIGKRIDQYCAVGLSRSHVQKLLQQGLILVNGVPVKANYKLRNGDEVEMTIPEAVSCEILPENIPLDIVYEDRDLLVVNKPKGMVVHPANGHSSGTLVNALLFHCGDSLSGINGVMRPGIVHRIDQDTTGLLVVCKNDAAHQFLAEQLSVHHITRKYRAIVHGIIKEDGFVDAPIGRSPKDRKKMAMNISNGRNAVTHYRVLETLPNDRKNGLTPGYTYIECQLETGRTHQIRVHMAGIGHPVVGDELYGPTKSSFKHLQGQTLHAMVLGFIHPSTKEYIEFEAPLPNYFEELLKKLR